MDIKKVDSGHSFTLPEKCEKFAAIYDDLQDKIAQVSITDELLAGMLMMYDFTMATSLLHM